jgi:hypothetical protein
VHKDDHFYQDRLGTNVGKALKKSVFFTVYATTTAPTDGCTPPPPAPPPPPPGSDPAVRAVNVSVTKNDALAMSSRTNGTITTFTLAYGKTAKEAQARADAAVGSADVAATMQARNSYILSLPPLPDAGDDRFQRKLLR